MIRDIDILRKYAEHYITLHEQYMKGDWELKLYIAQNKERLEKLIKIHNDYVEEAKFYTWWSS